MTTMIQQRTDYDCGLCCLAMALGLTYEQVHNSMPFEDRVLYDEKGYGFNREMEKRVLAVLGYVWERDWWRLHPSPNHAATYFMRHLLWGRRAIISAMSKNNVDGHHAIYWDGKELFDPSLKVTYKWEEVEAHEILIFNERAGK